ncbi:MAG: type II CAAX prenyl endopeptidase Rce1 family protein [Halolamina sp.]
MVGPHPSDDSLRRLLRGREDDRIRATWRVAVPLTLFVVVTYGSALFLVIPLLRRLDAPPVTNIDLAILGPLGLAASLAALAVASRLDRRPLSGFGFAFSRRWWTELVAGVIGGVLVSGVQAGYGVVLGGSEVTETFTSGSADAVVAATFLFLVGMTAVVVHEEIVFRAILVPNIAEGAAARGASASSAAVVALLGSSLLFVPMHWVGGVSIGESFAVETLGYFLMGALFALPYVLTGEVALSVGLHLAYNLANAFLFGVVGVSEVVPTAVMIDHPPAAVLELTLVRVAAGVVVVAGLVAFTRDELSLDRGLARPPARAR